MTVREEILKYIKGLKLSNYRSPVELPFEPNGKALYLSNPMSIFVDAEQTVTTPFLQLFDATIDQEVTTVSIFLATDAKKLPTDYTSVVNQLRAAKEVVPGAFFVRNSELTTDVENDLLITMVVITLSKILS